jgi:ribosomal-protein-alanine N-acetyltransferase
MGWCGIWYTSWIGGYELGYRYLPEFWGKGYATEAALAVVKEGFSVYPLNTLLAVTAKANRRSQRVLEKVGFTLEGEIYEEAVGANVLKYSLRRNVAESGPS